MPSSQLQNTCNTWTFIGLLKPCIGGLLRHAQGRGAPHRSSAVGGGLQIQIAQSNMENCSAQFILLPAGAQGLVDHCNGQRIVCRRAGRPTNEAGQPAAACLGTCCESHHAAGTILLPRRRLAPILGNHAAQVTLRNLIALHKAAAVLRQAEGREADGRGSSRAGMSEQRVN